MRWTQCSRWPPLPPRDVWLVKPAEGLSTPAVYKALGLAPEEELGGPDPDALLAARARRLAQSARDLYVPPPPPPSPFPPPPPPFQP